MITFTPRFFSFLDAFSDFLADEEVIELDAPPILKNIAMVITLFSRIGFDIPEKMKPIYKYIETLPHSKVDAETAIRLCLHMLQRGRYSAGAVQNLLKVSMHVSEMSREPRRDERTRFTLSYNMSSLFFPVLSVAVHHRSF